MSSDAFFQSKKAAAILKHAVLDQYVDPFSMKTGSRSPQGRVAFIDGYAGEGRYEGGEEGSPALLMRKARAMLGKRQIECMFVEQNEDHLDRLRDVVASEGGGLVVETFLGDVSDHLTKLLARTAGIPLFVFLDPFGLMIPFDDVAAIFKSRPGGLGAAGTEVLINFSTVALRRIAGHLTSATPTARTLERMDIVCGGDWWRDAWLAEAPTKDATDPQKEAAEEAVVNGYADRLGGAAPSGYWTFDVRNRAHYRAAYHLVFLTRHPDGLLLFGEALSLGLARWRRAIWEVESAGSLFDGDEEAFKSQEATLAGEWVDEIERNLRALLAKHGAVKISNHYAQVYGSALGRARELHLRAAWKRLLADGTTATDSKGKLIDKTIAPGPRQS